MSLEDEARAFTDQAERLLQAVRKVGTPTDAAAGMVMEYMIDALSDCREGLRVLEDLLSKTRCPRSGAELREFDTALVDLGICQQTMEGVQRLLGNARGGLLRIERGEVS
ncbi:hypothetical protein ACSNOI_08440 [Actinomadura kijaniata]|uniref:hypothetical protein n=1 Tax=Actinomadura kijaniata TaxID=46161 RepID=UPI003F1BFDAE